MVGGKGFDLHFQGENLVEGHPCCRAWGWETWSLVGYPHPLHFLFEDGTGFGDGSGLWAM